MVSIKRIRTRGVENLAICQKFGTIPLMRSLLIALTTRKPICPPTFYWINNWITTYGKLNQILRLQLNLVKPTRSTDWNTALTKKGENEDKQNKNRKMRERTRWHSKNVCVITAMRPEWNWSSQDLQPTLNFVKVFCLFVFVFCETSWIACFQSVHCCVVMSLLFKQLNNQWMGCRGGTSVGGIWLECC